MDNIFDQGDMMKIIARIESIDDKTERKWGKMDAAQMLAHCSKTFDSALKKNFKKPNFIMKAMVKLLAKETVVGNRPYKRNGQTPAEFVVKENRDLLPEKKILIDKIKQVSNLGISYFEGKEHPFFGVLTSNQWNTLMVKHTEHHLKQFGK